MKYRVGDLVKIKSLEWFKNTYPQDEFGTIIFEGRPGFIKEMEKDCGRIGEIMKTEQNGKFLLLRTNSRSNWRHYWINDWIEKVSIINIHLKQLKNEI